MSTETTPTGAAREKLRDQMAVVMSGEKIGRKDQPGGVRWGHLADAVIDLIEADPAAVLAAFPDLATAARREGAVQALRDAAASIRQGADSSITGTSGAIVARAFAETLTDRADAIEAEGSPS